jgi:hypothetical protein
VNRKIRIAAILYLFVFPFAYGADQPNAIYFGERAAQLTCREFTTTSKASKDAWLSWAAGRGG